MKKKISKILKAAKAKKAPAAFDKDDYLEMNSCRYQICSKAHDSIVLLKDENNTKLALPKEKIDILLRANYAKVYDKNGLQKAQPKASPPPPQSPHGTGHKGRPSVPIGTISNGRKKIRDGVWVDVATGRGHPEATGTEEHSPWKDPEARKIADKFAKIIGKYDKGHHKELSTKFVKMMQAKSDFLNIKEHHADERKTRGNNVSLQHEEHSQEAAHDKFRRSFKDLVQTLKDKKSKKEA
jgi:hypothetical protein